jgi:hypothetical protein
MLVMASVLTEGLRYIIQFMVLKLLHLHSSINVQVIWRSGNLSHAKIMFFLKDE